MNDWLLLLAPGAVGLALWFAFVGPRVRPEPPERARGLEPLALFLLGWAVNGVLLIVGFQLLGGDAGARQAADGTATGEAATANLLEAHGLGQVLAVQAAANLIAVLLVLGLARVLERGAPGAGLRALGLRRSSWRSLPGGLAAWLAFLPVLGLVSMLNVELLARFGDGEGMQAYLSALLDSAELRGSPQIWLWMVLVIPVAEEVLYRGALYAGLRALLGAPGAALLSGLAFGLGHDTAAMLPVFALGVMLAWLRERTGSLAAPIVAHVLQNGYTLTLASLAPESFA